MPKISLTLICYLLITSCSELEMRRVKEQVLTIAENYVKGQLILADKQVSDEGFMMLTDGVKKYYIDPSLIYTGLIDDDSLEDAMITIVSYEGSTLGVIEHLFILGTDEGFIMQKSFESDMKILDLKDRIITAELPTHPRSSPLYDCPDCREVVRYRYKMGELVKVE